MHSQETSEGLSPTTAGTDPNATADPPPNALIQPGPARQEPESSSQAPAVQAAEPAPKAGTDVGGGNPPSPAELPAARRIRIGSQRTGVVRLKPRPLSEPPYVPPPATRQPGAKRPVPQTAIPPQPSAPLPQPSTPPPLQASVVPPVPAPPAATPSAAATQPASSITTTSAEPPSVPAAARPPHQSVAAPPQPSPHTHAPQAAIGQAAVEQAAAPIEPVAEAGPPLPELPAVTPPPTPSAPATETPPAAPQEPPTPRKTPLPNLRAGLPPELEAEVQAALGELSLEEVLAREAQAPPEQELAAESRHLARVLRVTRDGVFVDLGGRNQGMLPRAQLAEPPAEGAQIDVVINRFDPEEGLYHVSLPSAATAVGDWSSVTEGMVVEARVTGVNKGGLECDVNNLRGFIPASQAAAWRVEDLSTLLGERLLCVVTEVDPERRKLVLSRRAMIEREREEARQKLHAELAEGQVREGVVRSLQDFGAFVDLGGVDGLIHVSQLSWQRVQHPREVLQVGQRVKVKVRKYDPATGKLSLSLRDLAENPWASAALKYPPTSRHQGVVTRLAQYGAFVELEPGIEGMVHISELAHGRVWRPSDVVQPGQQVEVQVLSVDPAQQRISLSLKAAQARPEPARAAEPEPEEPEPSPPPPPRKTPLRGGLGRSSGGERFGLKW